MLNLHLLNTKLNFLLYLNAQQCCPRQASNKRRNIHSGLFPYEVLLVRIGLKTKHLTQYNTQIQFNNNLFK